jgi:hypothetical protein
MTKPFLKGLFGLRRLVMLPALLLLFSCQETEKKAAVTKAQPVILELISADTSETTNARLKTFIKDDDRLYRWKSHYIVYSQTGDVAALQDSLKAVFPQVETKLYDNLYYNFNREHCDDTSTAKEWEHTILTANLVADTAMQREYMNYHATQFEEWPELSKGFCNARFQQLIMFRNGRQLMLVISIPKGESLDELNPKTTENNPRVDEWNKLMAKYQEGIAGTKEGEVWALFSMVM